MIYLVLDSFIVKSKSQYRKVLIAELIILAVAIVFLILSCVCNVFCAIGSGAALLLFFIILIVHDIKKRKEVDKRFDDYNSSLDELANILRNFLFSNEDNTNENWYSADRIKYLIKMCDNLIYTNIENKNKTIKFLKSAIIAIIGFGAGILAEKASLEINIVIGFVALVVVILIYCFSEIGEILNNLLFKSDSSEEIMNLKSALMDLLLRDFPESANLELEIDKNI